MEFIPVMTKLNIQQPLLQPSVSHDPSEIILICSSNILNEQLCYLIFFLKWKLWITRIIW